LATDETPAPQRQTANARPQASKPKLLRVNW